MCINLHSWCKRVGCLFVGVTRSSGKRQGGRPSINELKRTETKCLGGVKLINRNRRQASALTLRTYCLFTEKIDSCPVFDNHYYYYHNYEILDLSSISENCIFF